jgi:predicted nucleic acid-binding protein
MAGQAEAIVDASVAIKWLNQEEGTLEALKLREKHIEGSISLSAPNLILYEIANALRYKPDFDDEKTFLAVTTIIDLQIDLVIPGRDLLQQAILDAYLYDITVYDSCYLALGELVGIPVYTSDKKLYEKTKETGNMKII